MNKVILIGRLARDPQMRSTTQKHTTVASFDLAVARPSASGAEKITDFHRVIVYGKQAENCELYTCRGSLVGVEGSVQKRNYINKKGEKIYITEIIARNVEFLDYRMKQQNESPRASDDTVPEGFLPIDDEDIPF